MAHILDCNVAVLLVAIQMRLSDMVGLDTATLNRYPKVRELMTQAVNEDKQERQELRFQVRQEELD
jgi:hypothetical protein